MLLAPIGADVTFGDAATPAPTLGPSRLSVADQRILASGRASPLVGRPAPTVSFLTFEGTRIELHNRSKPVVLMFFDSPCSECEQELPKAAVIATILVDDAWVGVLASPLASAEVRSGIVDAGAGDLLYGGEDESGAIARSFGIERPVATVVLDGKSRVAGVWQRPIPAAVVTQAVRDGSGS